MPKIIKALPEGRPVIMLAPMAGFTDRAMRTVCNSFGADISVSEMVSAKAITFGSEKTMALSEIEEDEGRVAVQIFGKEPKTMAEAAAILCERGTRAEFIDINMGCPMQKIFGNGEGSALMRDPELIERIVERVNAYVSLPVTVKLRTGVDEEHLNAVECAQAAERGGAAMICVHGRTRAEFYTGVANREIIKNVKNSVRIPVVANGDVKSGEDALEMLSYTGADGVAVGRGAVGNPFIFAEIRAAIEGRSIPVYTLGERIEVALRQLKLACRYKGEKIAIPESRKQIAAYIHSFGGAASIRARINCSLTYSEVEQILLSELELLKKTEDE